MNVRKALSGKKAYLTGAAAVLGAVIAYVDGSATAMQAVQLAVTGLLGIFIRNGVAKLG